MDEWHYILHNTQQGPVPMAHLREYLSTGQLPAETMVWCNGMPAWIPANTIDELNVAPPPVYVPPPFVRSKVPPPGGIGNRFVAIVVDNIMVLVAAVAVTMMVGFVMLKASPADQDQQSARFVLTLFGSYYTFGWLYYAGLESSVRGATIGKRLQGIRVVDLHGDRISFLRATGRFFSKILSGFMMIGYIIALVSDKEQALQDQIAGTYVVKARKPARKT